MFDIMKSIIARGVAVLLVEQNVGQALEIATAPTSSSRAGP
jgi:ABC-type branched-subunit amino acid transport system ATPase component